MKAIEALLIRAKDHITRSSSHHRKLQRRVPGPVDRNRNLALANGDMVALRMALIWFCWLLLGCFGRSEKVEVVLDGRLTELEFDQWTMASVAASVAKNVTGAGCESDGCVAEMLCGEMAQALAQTLFQQVEEAVATRRTDLIAAAADDARDFVIPCREKKAGRLAALAEANAANWLPKSLKRGLDAAERALRFSDDETTRTVYETFRGMWDASFEGFEARTYEKLCEELDPGGRIHEGGLYLSHDDIFATKDAQAKRECFISALMDAAPAHAIEIGFNAGHSAAMLLSLFPTASMEIYDLCRYDYTLRGLTKLRQRFPLSEIVFLCGDSALTLTDVVRKNEEETRRADFVFVDGAHTYEAALRDLRNAHSRSKRPGATLVVDDCSGDVYRAWTDVMKEGLVTPHRPGVCWRGLCIGHTV